MVGLIIIGGTTEGRELAEHAAAMGILAMVSVTTSYGEKLLGGLAGVSVRCGPLGEEGICRLLEEGRPRLVVDATHPYAALATAHISSACQKAGIPCLRVKRERAQGPGAANDGAEIYWVHTWREASALLAKDQKPALFTIGSKGLADFVAEPHLKGRIYARVLPDSKVLASCEKMGLPGKQVLAMQGPFSVEMNCAMVRMANAGWLVTKESGKKGGFAEKLEAARICQIPVIVMGRPVNEEGVSLKEAKEILESWDWGQGLQRGGGAASENPQSQPCRVLSLIGMGMGGGGQLTLEAVEALELSDAVLGAPRMLEGVERWTRGKRREALYFGEAVVDWVKAHREYGRVAVVYSGDTGFYSGCASLLKLIRGEKGAGGLDVQVYPGISTLSCLCARFQKDWGGIYPASAHGRDCDVARLLRRHGRVFLLLGKQGLGGLCRRLAQEGLGQAQVFAGIRLGYPDEQVLSGRAGDFTGYEGCALAAVILEKASGEGPCTAGTL